jgi:peptide/nickel transport system substrate-binding protein
MRFVVTTNNANGSAVGLYKGQLIYSNGTQGIYIPKLVTQFPTLENGGWKVNPDNTMETRLTLRPNTLWHDGTPLTTKDIVFSDEVLLNKELPQTVSTVRTQFVDKLTAIDDRTLSITWKEPYIFADSFSPDMLPTHILEAKYRADPQSIANHPWITEEYVGTGPFKLKEFQPGSWQILTAFDG